MKKKVIFLSILILAILGAVLDSINSKKENNDSYVQTEKEQDTQVSNSKTEKIKEAEKVLENNDGTAKNLEDFIFPNSNNILLTENELKTLSKDKLALARNEIYARHGFIFSTQPYKDYFESKSWYVSNSSFKGSDEELNEIEIMNVQLIKMIEDEEFKDNTKNESTSDMVMIGDEDYIKILSEFPSLGGTMEKVPNYMNSKFKAKKNYQVIEYFNGEYNNLNIQAKTIDGILIFLNISLTSDKAKTQILDLSKVSALLTKQYGEPKTYLPEQGFSLWGLPSNPKHYISFSSKSGYIIGSMENDGD